MSTGQAPTSTLQIVVASLLLAMAFASLAIGLHIDFASGFGG